MKPGAIIIVIISILLWIVGFYTGIIGDIYFFGKNIFKGWIVGGNVVIPTDSNVTTIESRQYAFYFLNSVTIPENITTIKSDAFKGNRLSSITLPANVTIEANAIGGGFENFYALNKKFAGTYTRVDQISRQWTSWFENFSYTRTNSGIVIIGYTGPGGEVTIPVVVYDEKVTVIAKRAFIRKGINSVIIPGNVITIEEEAFANNYLTKIYLPNSVKSIGVDAFANNPIISVSLGANITLGSNNNNHGILGQATGFNSAYRTANNSRAGVYTRRSVESTGWGRATR